MTLEPNYQYQNALPRAANSDTVKGEGNSEHQNRFLTDLSGSNKPLVNMRHHELWLFQLEHKREERQKDATKGKESEQK